MWAPVNYLMITSLREHALYYGNDVTFEFPTGSGSCGDFPGGRCLNSPPSVQPAFLSALSPFLHHRCVGTYMGLDKIATALSDRLVDLFRKREDAGEVRLDCIAREVVACVVAACVWGGAQA